MASEITSASIVHSTVCSDADQRKHQSSASLAFVRGIHRRLDCLPNHLFRRRSRKISKLCVIGLCEGDSPVNSIHKGLTTRKMLPFYDVIMDDTLREPLAWMLTGIRIRNRNQCPRANWNSPFHNSFGISFVIIFLFGNKVVAFTQYFLLKDNVTPVSLSTQNKQYIYIYIYIFHGARSYLLSNIP